jgi:hypothetical protein
MESQASSQGPDDLPKFCEDTIIGDLEGLAESAAAEGGAGDFVSSRRHVGEGPGVEVVGFGLLPLPVNADVVASLRSAVGSNHPLKSELEVPAASLRFANAAWDSGRVPPSILSAIAEDLEVPEGATCAATLSKLVVSAPGDGAIALDAAAGSSEQPGALQPVRLGAAAGCYIVKCRAPVTCRSLRIPVCLPRGQMGRRRNAHQSRPDIPRVFVGGLAGVGRRS